MSRPITLVSFLLTFFVSLGYAQPTPVKAGSEVTKGTGVTNSVQGKFNAADKAKKQFAAKTSGEIFEIPFFDNFDDGDKTNKNYTFIDANGDGHDNINMWFWKEDEQLIQYNAEPGVTGDDWLITPGIHFDGKSKYQLKFNVNMGSESNLRVTLGTSPDPKDHEVILDLNKIWDSWTAPYDVIFDVPAEGTYYIGFQNYSVECFYFNLFDIQITSKEEYVPGTIFEIPYVDDFADGERTNAAYTFVDVDGDGHDNLSQWFWKEDEKLVQYCSDKEHNGNDWFITPPIHFDAKSMYDLMYTVNMGAPSNLKVFLGTSPDPKDMTTELMDLYQINEQFQMNYETSFKVPGEGVYYLGFYNYSDASSFYFNLFNISIAKGMSGQYPDQVNDLVIIPGENGEVSSVLKFTAPKTNISGEPLEGSYTIDIFCNEKLLETLEVLPGEEVTYVDEHVKPGMNNYKLIVKYEDLESVPTEKSVWIGPDISEPVKNFSAYTTEDNMNVVMNWEAPTKGANGGYFNIEDVEYRVYRSYDGENFDRLATIKELTYTDTEIADLLNGEQDSYFYAVTARTPGGESTPELKLMSVGTPYKVNNYESFENGKFNITPWTTESVEGSFSWECIRSDKDGGGYAQDHDKGLIKFANNWSEKADSRLKTPIFDLTGSENPTFSFYMFHWEESSVKEDNKQTKCTIEISVDGGAFEPIADSFTAAAPYYGWYEHRISLDKYKNAKKVQFGLRGYSDNTWMYFYVDNIRIDEQLENDLSVSEFFATKSAQVNETGYYDVRYLNRGTKEAKDYTIELYQDYELIGTIKGEPIQPGEYKTVTFNHVLNASKSDTESVFNAVINYAADMNTDDNTTWELGTKVTGTWYPSVENLKGESSATKGVDLQWTAPAIPDEPLIISEGFESYMPFLIKGIGDWTTVDNDQLGSGAPQDFPDFMNKGKDMAFIVWTPNNIDGFSSEKYPELMPRTGEKCILAWYANTSVDGSEIYNDDYLISPEVLGGSTLKFYIKRAGKDEAETYEIMYSTTDKNIESFQVLESKTAGAEWELVEVKLPEDARFFAIHYTAKVQTGIMIDDIEYASAVSALKLQGYNIFRDGALLNNGLLSATEYHDETADESVTYAYQVSAVYDRGESNACTPFYITIPAGIDNVETNMVVYPVENGIVIESNAAQHVGVYTTDGCAVASKVINGRTFIPTAEGLYIVKVAGKSYKVVVK